MTLRARIVVGAVAAILAVGLGFLWVGQHAQSQLDRRLSHALIQEKVTLWTKIVAAQRAQMEAGLYGLTRNAEFLAALSNGNVTEIGKAARPTFNRLKALRSIDTMTVLDANGRLVFADDSKLGSGSSFVQTVLREKKVATDLLTDDSGRVVIAFAFPLFSERRFAGVAIYGRMTTDALADLKETLKIDAAIRSSAKGAPIDATADFAKTAVARPVGHGGEFYDIKQVGDHYLELIVAPVHNASGAWIADLLTGADVTANHQALQKANLTIYAALGLILFLVVSTLYFYLGRVFAPLASTIEVVQSLARGDDSIVVEGTERGDEIGEFARAVQVFKDNTIEKRRLEIDAHVRQAEEHANEQAARQVEHLFHQELSTFVTAASAGNFSRRVKITSNGDLTSKLSRDLNVWAESIGSAFAQVNDVMASLANGDLSRRMEGQFSGDLLRLQGSVNRMVGSLSSITARITQSTGSVHDATLEIGSGVSDLAERTEQQASALEETAASMEQMAATVRQNASNAMEADRAATATRSLATSGGQIAVEAVAAMAKIEESSRQITEIVVLIEEIAFQTNILALNAAVEAARAGDAGRGFAVVANEVRALSQRSSQALKEIKTQIITSDASVKVGVGLVKQAGASLSEIAESVKKVAGLVAEIAAASHEQSSGIDQVSRAIHTMDEVTQRNATLVEETNAALESAQAQVGDLREAVRYFKLGRTGAETLAAAAAVARPFANDAAPASRYSEPTEAVQPAPVPQRNFASIASIDDFRAWSKDTKSSLGS